MSEDDIQNKVNDFVNAGIMSKEAGFDAIEIHAGHGYLLSQFLSPWTNHRKDKYGGSLENRMRFPMLIIKKLREALDPGFPILVKMNHRDGMKGGIEIDDAKRIAQEFEKNGASAIIPSAGFTSKTPFYMLRGNLPVSEMVKNQKNWISKIGLFHFGRFIVQEYPYEQLFQLKEAGKIKKAVNIPVIYVGGIKEKEDVQKALKVGFDFVQIGRALIHDPDFVIKFQTQERTNEICDHCNRCVAEMDAGGVHCTSRLKGYL